MNPDAFSEVAELPNRLQPFARALLEAGRIDVTIVARTLGVTRKKLVNIRREICWRMGRGSRLALALNPRMAKAYILNHANGHCARCGLRGHDAANCDLPGIEFYASIRRE